MGIQPEKREQERSDMGESVFPETDLISLFLVLLVYLLLHIGMNTESRRSRHLWKNTYLITDIERLETDSVVGRLVEKRKLNNLDYVE